MQQLLRASGATCGHRFGCGLRGAVAEGAGTDGVAVHQEAQGEGPRHGLLGLGGLQTTHAVLLLLVALGPPLWPPCGPPTLSGPPWFRSAPEPLFSRCEVLGEGLLRLPLSRVSIPLSFASTCFSRSAL